MIIPKRAYALFLLLLLGACLLLFSRTVGHSVAEYFFGPYGPLVPVTTHIVLFKFKHGTSSIAINELVSHFFGLKRLCIHPVTQKPYILSISGGIDNSIEDLQSGISHAFVVHFHSNEDRDYYVKIDPVHQTFKKVAGEIVEQAVVVDFQDGVFMDVS